MAISHLVRRADEAFVQSGVIEPSLPDSPWRILLFIFSVVGFGFAIFVINYTYGALVPTLAIVEDSDSDLLLRVDNDPANKQPGDPTAQDMGVEGVAAKPITSKLRTTVRHLRARGGRLAIFRGFGMAMLGGFIGMVPSFRVQYSVVWLLVAKLITAVLVANIHVAWVHIVISEPSSKSFYRRIPSFRSLPKVFPAFALMYVGSSTVAATITFLGLLIAGTENDTPVDFTKGVRESDFIIYTIALLVGFLVSVPAEVIFTRVAASTLPEEDESIVPFDRSFGGKVAPAVTGGGVLSIADAWNTFDRDGWKRYIKATVKAWLMQVAAIVLFSVLIVAQSVVQIRKEGSDKS
ncbi:uncharacterized protein APUU_10161A [Aspergillus puulaauensis]|uniref:Uncharacterized protein n=1 Tax=Aspergillus puulaauensis TaxID=1220207 RepID=A0A7R8AHC4_9EURO|nr:uncharacterized protein APUU_10161A [Aspergillus puulaauensis]BCS17333.1 hypothetical protein APUU_10161A [Aspergillus puulaauensis]